MLSDPGPGVIGNALTRREHAGNSHDVPGAHARQRLDALRRVFVQGGFIELERGRAMDGGQTTTTHNRHRVIAVQRKIGCGGIRLLANQLNTITRRIPDRVAVLQ